MIVVMLVLPSLMVNFWKEEASEKEEVAAAPLANKDDPVISVYRVEEQRIIEVPLEKYIRGVVAAEMPADFQLEALKAQALAARTYIANRLLTDQGTDMEKIDAAAKGSHVSDSVQHQVYESDEQLKEKWGSEYEEKIKKINQAVQETRGKIILYNGKPIYAAFFSTSNGRTENSEDYFEKAYPYLRSVSSIWDQKSPKYMDHKKMTVSDAIQRIEKKTGKKITLPAGVGGDWMKIIKRTAGGQVGKVKIGDQELTGREIREALELASADFSWSVHKETIIFQTRGYGHGVGMSQWGANLMAQEGKSAEEIVKHYYQGVEIADLQPLLASKNDN